MTDKFTAEDRSDVAADGKLVWVAPRLDHISAGSAEDGFGANADAGQPS